MASKVGSKQQGDQELDPKYEWQENAANYVLRLHLSGFRKEDFRVQVDGAGRLTVRGQRADGGKHVRFHKVFQLPPTSNLDDISGRFDAGILSLTVPKRPPATIDDIRKPAKQVQEEKPKPQVQAKDDDAKKTQDKKAETAMKTPTKEEDEASKKKAAADDKKIKEEETAAKIKKAAADEKKIKEEEMEARKKKAAEDEKKIREEEMAARIKKAAADEKKIREEEMAAKIKKAAAGEQMKMEANKQRAEQEHKRKEEEAKPKPAVDRDSILETVRRRAEEERAKAAAEEAAAERQKKQQQGGWKERVTEELQGLRTSEWAEGMVDTVKKNKEVIAAAVAAFSLGLFVSNRLFSRN